MIGKKVVAPAYNQMVAEAIGNGVRVDQREAWRQAIAPAFPAGVPVLSDPSWFWLPVVRAHAARAAGVDHRLGRSLLSFGRDLVALIGCDPMFRR